MSSPHFLGAVSRGFTENYAFTPANNFRALCTGEGKIQMSHFALFNNTCYMRGQQTFKIFDRLLRACSSARHSSPKSSCRRRLYVSGSIAVAEREKKKRVKQRSTHPRFMGAEFSHVTFPGPRDKRREKRMKRGGMTALSWRLADMAVSSYKS